MPAEDNMVAPSYIGIISFFAFIAAIIVLGVLIWLINKKHTAVKNIGYYYNAVSQLNSIYRFFPIRKRTSIVYRAKSKKALEKLDLDSVVIYHIENNINGFRENIEHYIKNKQLFHDYDLEYNRIIQIAHHYSAEDLKGTPFKQESSFLSCETRMLRKIKEKGSFDFTVFVHASYTSPKGQNSYSKKATFYCERVLQCYNQWLNSKKYKISSAYERSLMSDSLRYDILKRDGFRCCICGATAKDGATLHVDHIIPVSKGGKTVPSNLQTLCERCNLGKSNKL